ncbi:MAG TPA: trypsin-like serine protease [Ignavibacteria bacterium]|nr:trypsin-like serine protease [Ignavibacteria bacterium]
MLRTIKKLGLIAAALVFQSLIVRDDVPDEKFIELAKQYPQICHFPMGEGTLIDSSWIITAGHIGTDLLRDIKNGYKPKVICNENEYAIDKIIVHPGFKSIEEGLQNDIALVQVKGKIDNVIPANLYDKQDEAGKEITIVGMGDMGTGISGPLKWDKITRAATNRIDGLENGWLYFTFDSPGSENVTSLEGISGPGDSGGPAITDTDGKRYIIGISSHQQGQNKYGRGRYGVTEYYTRISFFYTWITESINIK